MSEEIVSTVVDPDARLVKQAIAELPYVTKTYELLIRQHYTGLYRTCLAILANPSDAEEACQATLLRIFNGLTKFEGRSSFKTWATRIATNVSLTIRQKRHQAMEMQISIDDVNENEFKEATTSSPEDLHRDSFSSMVNHLSLEEQEILTLRFVNDLALSEISDLLGIKLSATKMRFYRALEKLKPSLE